MNLMTVFPSAAANGYPKYEPPERKAKRSICGASFQEVLERAKAEQAALAESSQPNTHYYIKEQNTCWNSK